MSNTSAHKKFIRLLAMLLVVPIVTMLLPVTAFAGSAIGSVEELHGNGSSGTNSLSDGGHYMSNKYRNNYYLDIEELGLMDVIPKAFSALANAIFSFDRMLVEMTAVFYYRLSNLQISDLIDGGINDIQRSIFERIFTPLLPLAVIALGTFLAMLLLKRNGSAVMGQVISFFAVITVATVMTTQTASIVRTIDNLTQSITQELTGAMSRVTGEGGDNRGATAAVAGAMWDTMIHEPWVGLNLDGNDSSMAHALLSERPNSEERAEIIKKQVKKDGNSLFLKDRPLSQLGVLVLHTLVVVLKCAIYLCLSFLQLAFRIFTVLLVLLGGLLFFLGLIPQLGGVRILSSWCRKLLGVQLDILVLGLLMGFILWIDKLLAAWMAGWGWVMVLFAQAGICMALFVFRGKVVDLTRLVDRTVSSQRGINKATQALQNMDMYNTARAAYSGISSAYDSSTKALGSMTQHIHPTSVNFRETLERRKAGAAARQTASQRVYYYDTPQPTAASATASGASYSTSHRMERTAYGAATVLPPNQPMPYSSDRGNAIPPPLRPSLYLYSRDTAATMPPIQPVLFPAQGERGESRQNTEQPTAATAASYVAATGTVMPHDATAPTAASALPRYYDNRYTAVALRQAPQPVHLVSARTQPAVAAQTVAGGTPANHPAPTRPIWTAVQNPTHFDTVSPTQQAVELLKPSTAQNIAPSKPTKTSRLAAANKTARQDAGQPLRPAIAERSEPSATAAVVPRVRSTASHRSAVNDDTNRQRPTIAQISSSSDFDAQNISNIENAQKPLKLPKNVVLDNSVVPTRQIKRTSPENRPKLQPISARRPVRK